MFNENTWKYGEDKTKSYLEKKGYKILYTNFSCVGVELDIVSLLTVSVQRKYLKKELHEKLKSDEIKKDKLRQKILTETFDNISRGLSDLLVITEVKARQTDKFGFGFEAINDYKMNNIRRGAKYLLRQERFLGMQVRFDVASVDGDELTYIENAF